MGKPRRTQLQRRTIGSGGMSRVGETVFLREETLTDCPVPNGQSWKHTYKSRYIDRTGCICVFRSSHVYTHSYMSQKKRPWIWERAKEGKWTWREDKKGKNGKIILQIPKIEKIKRNNRSGFYSSGLVVSGFVFKSHIEETILSPGVLLVPLLRAVNHEWMDLCLGAILCSIVLYVCLRLVLYCFGNYLCSVFWN